MSVTKKEAVMKDTSLNNDNNWVQQTVQQIPTKNPKKAFCELEYGTLFDYGVVQPTPKQSHQPIRTKGNITEPIRAQSKITQIPRSTGKRERPCCNFFKF